MKVKLTIVILLLTAYAGAVSAQVTIGDGTAPQDFSVLEISTTMTIGGLRLPQLTNDQRIALTSSVKFQNEIVLKGRGLMIYNTTNGCVEYWNEQRWISLCEGCSEITSVSISGGTTITQWARTAITLTANVTGGTPTSYEWYLGGSKVATTATSTYTVPQGVKDASGTKAYTVKAINACSDATSSVANVVVTACTKITGVSISGGTTITQWAIPAVTLTANVTGGTPTSYEWYLGGVYVTTTTTNTYTVPQSVKDVADTYTYTVKAINACSDATSTASNVVVTACGKITGTLISGGTTITQWATTAITLTAYVTGGTATSYEWYLGGTMIPGATNSTYTVPQSVKDAAGTYTYSVWTSNACTGSYSITTNVVVTPYPKITGVSISGGTSILQWATTDITLTANVTGGTPTSYEWYLGGSKVATTATNTYTVPQSVKDVAGTGTSTKTYAYTVKAINACSNATSSATNVVVTGCGAYLAGTTWKAFMCHNLGADQSLPPFTPAKGLNGDYYQWGYKAAVAGVDGLYFGVWNTTAAPNGAWSSTTKTYNDPCPTGLRLPTSDEWVTIRSNTSNPVTYVGSWTVSATGFDSGIKLGNSLYLPAAGWLRSTTGALQVRNSEGHYWSRTAEDSDAARAFAFSDGYTSSNVITSRTYGLSVRCIAQ
ncbi:fibrobacter succinogenes major paralogous domain-containing protein [Dysgonomonas reticulitermitis]